MKSAIGWAFFVGVFFLLDPPALPALPDQPARPDPSAAQASFEQVAGELSSESSASRLRAVRLLREAAYPEAALPLAKVVLDPQDEIQLEAIAAELDIFLSERLVIRRRVGLVVEVRNGTAADAAFSRGPLALGPRPVPGEVVTALLTATHDTNPRVAVEALYAFGTLAVAPSGDARRRLLRTAGPDLTAMISGAEPAVRYGALRVIGRLFARRPQDDPIDQALGDAVIGGLNDRDLGVRGAAVETLGAMRYERAVQALTEQYEYAGRSDTSGTILNALAWIAHPSSASLFASQVTSKSAATKTIAIEGLVRVGDRTSLGGIQTALGGDGREGVVLAGAFASAVLGGTPIDPIVEGLRRPKLADQARQYLIGLAPGRIMAFARFAQDPDTQIRAGVADALGLAGDPSARSLVESMARDGDPLVAAAAQRALARLR